MNRNQKLPTPKILALALIAAWMSAPRFTCAADEAPSGPTTQPAGLTVLPIYPGVAPGSEDWKQTEVTYYAGSQRRVMVRNVTRPTLTYFQADSARANGTAIIIAPGGGFRVLSWENEGTAAAEWLAARGVAAFVLKYRLADTGASQEDFEKGRPPATRSATPSGDANVATSQPRAVDVGELACADGAQAIRYLRGQAETLHIASDRIGIMGFSAGGVVAVRVALQHDAQSRPDFVVAIYGAGRDVAIPADAPPLFICCAADDKRNAPQALALEQAYLDSGHLAELHLYEKGGHGFGMAPRGLPVDHWIDRLGDWLIEGTWMKPR